MRKITLLLTLILLLLPAAAFAGGKSEAKTVEPAAKVELKYWSLFGGPDGEVMKSMVGEFNSEHENIFVDFNITKWDNYYAQLTAAIAGGNAPDIAIAHTRNLPAFASEKLLYTLDEALAKKGLGQSKFIPLAWKGGAIGGKRYALPLDIIIAMVLYYNKDHFQTAGLKAEEPKDGAELIANAKKLQNTGAKWGLDVPLTGFRLYRYWFSALNQNGDQLLSDDLKKAAFNTDGGVEALQFWVDAVYKHKVGSDRSLGEGEGFKFGTAAMAFDGIWMARGFDAQEGLNWDLFPMPALFKPGNRSFFSNSHNFILPKPKRLSEARRDAAVTFIMWMSDNSLTWSAEGHMVSARKDIVEKPEFKQLAFMDRLPKQAEYAKYPPPIKQTGEVQNAVIKALEFAMAQKKTPAQALKDAEDEVNKILK